MKTKITISNKKCVFLILNFMWDSLFCFPKGPGANGQKCKKRPFNYFFHLVEWFSAWILPLF